MVAKTLDPLAAEDADLNRRVRNFLHGRHVPRTEDLQMESHFGTLVISGKLASKHDKWLCLECCRRVAGVVKLIDQVEVCKPSRANRELPLVKDTDETK